MLAYQSGVTLKAQRRESCPYINGMALALWQLKRFVSTTERKLR